MKKEKISVKKLRNSNSRSLLSKSFLPFEQIAIALLSIVLITSCEKEEIEPDNIESGTIATTEKSKEQNSKNASQTWKWGSHRYWTPSLPPKPSSSPGNSASRSWGQYNVYNANDLANAVQRATNNQIIYIHRTIYTNANYTIRNSGVKVVSRNGVKIVDQKGGGGLSALFNVNGSNVTFENVTIQGPGWWSGKRSAIAFSGSNGKVIRCRINNYSHAAIRLENGGGHYIYNNTLFNQNNSSLGYGVLLRGAWTTATINRNMFDRNSHSVATNGNDNQSYSATGNYCKNSRKWHFDVHKGSSGYYSGKKVTLRKNVVDGSNTLFVVRGRMSQGLDIQENVLRKGAGDLVKIKADASMSFNGAVISKGNFYNPFSSNASERTTARNFLRNSTVKNNHINRNVWF